MFRYLMENLIEKKVKNEKKVPSLTDAGFIEINKNRRKKRIH